MGVKWILEDYPNFLLKKENLMVTKCTLLGGTVWYQLMAIGMSIQGLHKPYTKILSLFHEVKCNKMTSLKFMDFMRQVQF